MDQVISSAAGEQPAPFGEVMGEVMDRGMSGALPVDAQLQAGQRSSRCVSQPCWLTSTCGLEPPQQRRDDRVGEVFALVRVLGTDP